MPFRFDMASTEEGIELRNPEAASPAAALPKKDLLFMIIVLMYECIKIVQAPIAMGSLLTGTKVKH